MAPRPDSKNSFKNSLISAFRGLFICTRERNFRIHLLAAFLVTIAGFIFKISPTQWLIILILFAVVISAEMLNSAIERLANLIEPNVNPHIRDLKDIAAGAVLLTCIVSIIIGIAIFVPEILKFFKNISIHW